MKNINQRAENFVHSKERKDRSVAWLKKMFNLPKTEEEPQELTEEEKKTFMLDKHALAVDYR